MRLPAVINELVKIGFCDSVSCYLMRGFKTLRSGTGWGRGHLSGCWGNLRLLVRTKREMMSFLSGNYKFYYPGLLRRSSGIIVSLPGFSCYRETGVLNSRLSRSKSAHFMSILSKICVLPTANQVVQRGKYLPKFCLAR